MGVSLRAILERSAEDARRAEAGVDVRQLIVEYSNKYMFQEAALAQKNGPSRRAALVGLGATAFAAAAAVRARATPIAVGAAELSVVSDGRLQLPMAFALPDRTPEEIAALFAPHGLPTEALTPDCNVTLARLGDRLVLFDVGAGAAFQSTAGRLIDNLAALGVAPEAVTDVLLTHAHPDHLWGAVDDFDELAFPEARWHISSAEWDFWRADATLEATPDERKSFVVGARARFAAIEPRLALIAPGDEPVPGVEAIDSAGHTPGHLAFMIRSGSDSALVLGDALSHAVVSFERPDWRWGADHDPERAAATRAMLLDRAAGERPRIVGFHLPYPGVGRVERVGVAYRFAPE